MVPNQAQDDDQVMSLVELALARPVDDRETYVRGACAGDSELFSRVWQYVQWEERMNGFLLDPVFGPELHEHPFEPGELLDCRFRIVRKVAEGGMGVVYEAVDEKLERRIAIKCAKAGFRKRLPPEARHATGIAHPNVCKIFEIHTATTQQGEIDFLTMEFLEGETLADRLRNGPLAKDQARTIALQLCAGLAEAHRNQVIHGDLKSNNAILTRATDGAIRAVITDFGLARRPESGQRAAQSGEIGGAPDYMAPELLKGARPSIASDLYALGVILHELVAGCRPFRASREEQLHQTPQPLPSKWASTLARCLDPDPSQRFSSADEVAQALTPYSRRWFLTAAAAVFLAIVSGVVTYQRARVPQESVRLAMLPFEADASTVSLGGGLLQDTGDRLSRVKPGRARFTLIPLRDALQNNVNRPEEAGSRLGATHSLSGTLRQENGHIIVRAYLTDTRARVNLADWSADYATSELGVCRLRWPAWLPERSACRRSPPQPL